MPTRPRPTARQRKSYPDGAPAVHHITVPQKIGKTDGIHR